MEPITKRFCSICLDTKSPEVFNCLPCLHWFCRSCLGKLVQNVCPLCRFPFETVTTVSDPSVIGLLSRSAPIERVGRLQIGRDPVMSRSADNTTRDLEMMANFTGIQNVDSLSRVLIDLEGRERQYRRRRRRRRRMHPSSSIRSSLLPDIFQFDENSNGDSKSESPEPESPEPESPEPKRRRMGRGDRWAHLNRQRAHRRGR